MANESLRFSRFAHLLKKDGIGALWHSLRLEVVFVREPLLGILQEFRYCATIEKILARVQRLNEKVNLGQLIEMLKQTGILVPIHYDEMAALKEIRESNLKVAVGILYLLLTDACNFRCKYCFIENTTPSSHKFSMMSEKTARAALDFFAECLRKNPPGYQSKKNNYILRR